MLQSRIQMILWLFSIGIFYLFSLSFFAFFLFIISIVTVFFLWISTKFMIKNLDFTIWSPEIANKNEETIYYLETKNRSILPITKIKCTLSIYHLLTGETKKQDVFYAIQGKGKQRIPLTIFTGYCGTVKITIENVICYDFFGVFSVQKKPNIITDLCVLPNSFIMDIDLHDTNLETKNGIHSSSLGSRQDNSDLFGIKEYTIDDNVKHIHWKLTSKFDQLIMKEYSEVVAISALLLLETSVDEGKRDSPEVMDAKLEAFITIAQTMLIKGYRLSIGWYNHELEKLLIEEVHSFEQLTSLVRMLLKTEIKVSKQFTITEYEDNYDAISFSHIIYLTSENTRRKSTLEQLTLLTCVTVTDNADHKIADGIVFTPETMKEDLHQLSI